ncbi:MAG: rRNA maturation RNase YbeY, partial [Treponema sp.]|nr:rRNA maturation RNase YbeY [Treponema sp.]
PGDIVISLDALAENAVFFDVSPEDELRRLLIHGILHLTGMDHATNEMAEPMLQKQEALLGELSAEPAIMEADAAANVSITAEAADRPARLPKKEKR